jgi:cytochrome c biogenesis protein
MSTLEEISAKTVAAIPAQEKRRKESLVSRFMDLISSVRFGIVLLILLGLFCLIGMLVVQENVDGFTNYYAALMPAQKLVYGKLDLFDIYHSWYFNALLAVLSLNIILASIDRFPKIWALISKPPVTVPIRWLRDQKQTREIYFQGTREEIEKQIENALRESGWKKIKTGEKMGRKFVFGESGKWNRLSFLAVHVALLTIFTGGFLTGQLGHNGQMPLMPGQSSDEMFETAFELNEVQQFQMRLPFEVICTDIQQKLIRKDGSITAGNTIDWLTHIKIKDGGKTHEAVVHMNNPFDYRGYRFFQSSFVSTGRARNITLGLTPADGGKMQKITIPRDGVKTLPDGTKIAFAEFRGKFSIGQEDPNEDTSNYPNPGAILRVTPPAGGAPQNAYAFGDQMAEIPVAKQPVAGYTYKLLDFEKVADQHILAVQYDPGANVVYLGFALLFLTLVVVFFFSHQRVWAALEEVSENEFKAIFGGNTNRNQNAFEEKFNRFIETLWNKQNQELSKKL